MQRRGFLGAILAAGVAPAFVGSSVLMPVRKVIAPLTPLRFVSVPPPLVYLNGISLLPGLDFVEKANGAIQFLAGQPRASNWIQVVRCNEAMRGAKAMML